MDRRLAAMVVIPLLAGSLAAKASADIYTVLTNDDSGPGTLRWAIEQANNHAGTDKIEFDPSLMGEGIRPASALPILTDDNTTIEGDINKDGLPDIALNGKFAGDVAGLELRGDGCVISGMAVVRFAKAGILIRFAQQCVIRKCHVGVNLAGGGVAFNGGHQVRLFMADNNTIGGAQSSGRNIIAGGPNIPSTGSGSGFRGAGIYVYNSAHNHIRNCNIGIARDGVTRLADEASAGIGIYLRGGPVRVASQEIDGRTISALNTKHNLIGGTTGPERNVFGGLYRGIELRETSDNKIKGNYFGLGRDGVTQVSFRYDAILFAYKCHDNTVGGSWVGGRNVFAASEYGIRFTTPFTTGSEIYDNTVSGNYFGMSADGTQQKQLDIAIELNGDSGPQAIGFNVFNNRPWKYELGSTGIRLQAGGEGSLITYNQFGLRPQTGRFRSRVGTGIQVGSVEAEIIGNIFDTPETGISCSNTPNSTLIRQNQFKDCDTGVFFGGFTGADATLGIGIGATAGHNRFYDSNDWYIRNEGPKYIRTEGNRWPTTSIAAIKAKIWDRGDDSSLGKVDITPLGVVLSGDIAAGSLAVANASALPTPLGAEVVFTLTRPADITVTVLNLAGRPIRTVCAAQSCAAGLNALTWNGVANNGVAAPPGPYLVEIAASTEDGQAAKALTRVDLRR